MGHSAGGQQRIRSRHGDVLAVYTRAHDPDCPVVCLDETSKQLVAETRVPIAAKPGIPHGTTMSMSMSVMEPATCS